MATEFKLRRGTTAEHSNFTGAEAEVTVDTDKNTVVVHDGATEGGYPLATGQRVLVANSVSDLEATTGSFEGELANVAGTTFRWNSTSSEWQPANEINLLAFGRSTDITQALTDAAAFVATLPAPIPVRIPAGNYTMSSRVTINTDFTLIGDGHAVTRIDAPGVGKPIVVDSESTTETVEFNMSGIKMVGDVVGLGFEEHKHLLNISGVGNCTIENNAFIGFQGDGIYLGSSIVGGVERHNRNVTIRNNYIDGINNDNRNGITVIDGDGIWIEGNKFVNTTRANMPGAIDVEPNNYTFGVIKNIHISRNVITNCGGNVANIAFIRPGTTPDGDYYGEINVTDNIVNSPNNISVAFSFGTSTKPAKNVIVSNNHFIVSRAINFAPSSNIENMSITNNVINFNKTGIIGYNQNGVFENISLSSNKFVTAGTSYPMKISAASMVGLTLNGNEFIDNSGAGQSVNIDNVASSDISVINNIFRNNGNVGVTQNGSTDAASNFVNGNFGAKIRLEAFATDQPNLYNGDTATTFNGDNPPGDFPNGVSKAVINGNSSVPNLGGRQGVLETFKYADAEKFQWQRYTSANNGTGLGSVFIRKATGSNSWESWYETSGTQY